VLDLFISKLNASRKSLSGDNQSALYQTILNCLQHLASDISSVLRSLAKLGYKVPHRSHAWEFLDEIPRVLDSMSVQQVKSGSPIQAFILLLSSIFI
jgi:hypothetical protein